VTNPTTFGLARWTPAGYNSAVTAELKLSLLDCDRSDPLADFFDAHAAIECRGAMLETTFVVAGRDLEVFATDLGRVPRAGDASALWLGGWETERNLRLQVTRAAPSDAGLVRVSMMSEDQESDIPRRMKTEFIVPFASLSKFSMDIQQLVERRIAGDATLTGEADGNE